MKGKLKSSLSAGIVTLLLLFSPMQGEIKNIAKTYLGIYECTQATLGSKDLLPEFSYLSLELKDEENFLLHYQEKEGKRKRIEGKYTYDGARGILTLTENKLGVKKEIPIKEGKIILTVPMGGKTLLLQFEQK